MPLSKAHSGESPILSKYCSLPPPPTAPQLSEMSPKGSRSLLFVKQTGDPCCILSNVHKVRLFGGNLLWPNWLFFCCSHSYILI